MIYNQTVTWTAFAILAMFFFYIFGLGLEISIIIWYNNISLIICKICKIKDISLSHEAILVKIYFLKIRWNSAATFLPEPTSQQMSRALGEEISTHLWSEAVVFLPHLHHLLYLKKNSFSISLTQYSSLSFGLPFSLSFSQIPIMKSFPFFECQSIKLIYLCLAKRNSSKVQIL